MKTARTASNTMRHGRPEVLSLQAVDRGGARPRLLDDDRGGAYTGPFGRSTSRLGTAAGDRCVFWRSTGLRFSQIDHVLAPILLLLCSSEKKFSRSLRFSWPRAEGSSSAPRRSRLEIQNRPHDCDQTPG